MAEEFSPSYGLIGEAMRRPEVAAAIEAKAREIAARANAIGDAEGVDMDARVVTGVRPKGRPYANVVSEQVGQEWGTDRTGRRRILGRAAGTER